MKMFIWGIILASTPRPTWTKISRSKAGAARESAEPNRVLP